MMRKKTALLLVLLLSQIIITAQSLEGDWKGTFTQNLKYSNKIYEIIIHLNKINDTEYEGFSKTIITVSKNKFDTSICIVKGDFKQSSGLHLKEVQLIKGYETTNSGCFLDMDLSLSFRKKRKIMELSGYWTNPNSYNCGDGPIKITKEE